MSDKLTDYAVRSVARLLSADPELELDSYVLTPDFDWNNKPDPANPGNNTVSRPLPFAGIVVISDGTMPWSMSHNIVHERSITMAIHVCETKHTNCVNTTCTIRQKIGSATNEMTGAIGVTLYDFAVVSGSFYATAGTMDVDMARSEYFGPEEEMDEDNRKYKSVTIIELTAFKDITSTLLEDGGRLNLTGY